MYGCSTHKGRRWSRKVLCLTLAAAMFSALVGIASPAAALPGTPTYESEPNDSSAQANALAVDGTIMNGTYSTAADNDWYAISLVAGVAYNLEMGPNTDYPTTMSDVYLELWDTDGTTLLQGNDDWHSLFSMIQYTPTVSGTYYLNTHYLGYWNAGSYGLRVYERGTLSGTATIRGTVVDESDAPLEGAAVSDYYVDPWFAFWGLWSDGPSTTTASDGTYSMSVSAGSHQVGFSLLGYVDQYYDGERYRDSAEVLVLEADEIQTGIDAVMAEVVPAETYVTETIRASLDAAGNEGVDLDDDYRGSRTAAISADGRYTVFFSGNAFDQNYETTEREWYRKDNATGVIELVSVATDGTTSDDSWNEDDGRASISADGRYVAFDSPASTLVDGDTNEYDDVFVRDMQEGTTIRISTGMEGETNDNSVNPSISNDGRYVAFDSWADNLVEDDTNDVRDIFVYDMQTGDIARVSLDAEGVEADRGSKYPDISGDGSTVAFLTGAAFVEDDTNGVGDGDGIDVYVKTLEDGSIARANVASDGTEANDSTWDFPAISDDGQVVAFSSDADNLYEEDTNENQDIFVHDFVSGDTTLVSVTSDGEQSWDHCEMPAISGDGRYVAFGDEFDKMGPGLPAPIAPAALVNGDYSDEDAIVVHDRVTGSTTIVSVSSDGMPADEGSYGAAVNGDGTVIAYDSFANTLVTDDTNDARDVFVSALEYVKSDVTETPLQGVDRYETSVRVSQDAFPDGAESVVVATGENWPDALGGSALAGMVNGPVLLSHKAALSASVADEIDRLGASEAYVLGDFRALSSGVYNALVAKLGPNRVHRLGGVDRYATANLVAAEVVDMQGPDYDGRAFVATGLNFADALAASPIAAANGWPVYLSGAPTISDDTVLAMQNAGVTDCILLGDEAAMPEGTSIIILGAGFSAVRIHGADRYATAAKVAEFGVTDGGLSWNGVAVATGERFPDALSGGAAQGLNGSVMLLSRSTFLPTPTATAISAHASSISMVRFLGGPTALSQSVRNAIMGILTP